MPTRRAARKLAKMAVTPVHSAPPPGEPSIWMALARAVAAEDRLYLWALTALIVLAAAIRLYVIDRPMNYDETYSYLTYASRSLADALSNYSQPNNHLWHTALVHLSTALFGNAPWAIRLPAFLAGVLLAPATYLAARMLAAGRGALIAAALVAGSQILINFSTNARGYTWQCLFVLLALCGLLYQRTVARRRDGLWLFAIASALGFYTVPTMLYAFLGLAFWYAVLVLIDGAPETRRAQWLALATAMAGAVLLTVFLYLPVFIASGVGALTKSAAPLSSAAFNSRLWSMTGGTIELVHRGMPMLLPEFFMLCIAIHVFHHKRHREMHGQLLLLLGLLLAGIMVLLLQRAVPFARSWLYLLPVYFICVASGLDVLLELAGQRAARWLPVAAALALLILINPHVWMTLCARTYNPAGIDRVGGFMAGHLCPGDAFGATGYLATPIAYYLARAGHATRQVGGSWALELWAEPLTDGPFKGDTVRRFLLALRPIDQPKADRFLREYVSKQGKQYEQRDVAAFGTIRIVEVSGAGLSLRRPRRPSAFDRTSPRRRTGSGRRNGPRRPSPDGRHRPDLQNALAPGRPRPARLHRIPGTSFLRGDHDLLVGEITGRPPQPLPALAGCLGAR